MDNTAIALHEELSEVELIKLVDEYYVSVGPLDCHTEELPALRFTHYLARIWNLY